MGLPLRHHRPSITVAVAGLLTIASAGLATWAIRADHRADRADADLKEARAGAARQREAARLAAANEEEARARLADSRRLAALSEAEREKHPDRALLLAVEAIRREDTLEARGSLLDALLTRPAVTAYYHRARGLVLSVAFSPDGKTLAAGCYDGPRAGLVLLCDPSRSTETPLAVPEGVVRTVAFSRDGKTLAAGYHRTQKEGGVVLWDLERRARLGDRPLDVPGSAVSSLAFSPDGKTLAVGCSSGRVVLWDVSRRVRLTEEPLLISERYEVTGLAFSPDGKTFIPVGDGVVELWDSANWKRVSVLSRPETESIECVAFSPDGKTLAAGLDGYDDVHGGVMLWDMVGRHRLTEERLPVPADRVTSLTFSPDGKALAVGFRNINFVGSGRISRGGVVLFDLDLESWKERAGRIANRNLTRDEWRQYLPDTPYHVTFDDRPVPPADEPGRTSEPATGARGAAADRP